MADTRPRNIAPIRPSSFRELEDDYEAAAVAADWQRVQDRRARRRDAWGMHPALAYLIIAMTAVLWVVIGWIVHDTIESYDDDPGKVLTEVPETTTTGTLPEPRP